eukprot:CAMPEP_0177640140 /NCGR_PEP_ID=MMETSP0447-20121125/6387_1 /TAXON_ID=0 /ORGANISM="Stygamoeba regulata, Strain BSH-02190019" /LENGTH=331 /DNA_ID=CAMNT_0019142197 /DNA_START=150 /DNA_END=1148 /DNA_ORIENTATION=+
MTVQLLLNYWLGAGLSVDGVYGAATTQAVSTFQSKMGLQVDGEMGPQTWTALVVQCSSSENAAGDAVLAVQQQLNYWQFPVALTARFDTQTANATQFFQRSRGAEVDGVVGPNTWNLLVSGCNSSLTTQLYGLDIGWPEGLVDASAFSCLYASGFRFLILECFTESHGFWQDAVTNAKNARSAGFSRIGMYHFFNRTLDPYQQVNDTIWNLRENHVQFDRLWFDIEGTWPSDTASNTQFLERAQQAVADNQVPGGIYCGRQWPQYFGPYAGAKEWPLWYAHYDSIPSFRDWYGEPYGGWTAPTIKQYDADGSSTRHCGIEIDSDWTPAYPN